MITSGLFAGTTIVTYNSTRTPSISLMSTQPKLESVSVDLLAASASILSYKTSESHRMKIGRNLRTNMDGAASRFTEDLVKVSLRLSRIYSIAVKREKIRACDWLKRPTELTSGSSTATKSTPSTRPALYMFCDRGEATQPPREASGWLTLCRLYPSIELEVYRTIRTS